MLRKYTVEIENKKLSFYIEQTLFEAQVRGTTFNDKSDQIVSLMCVLFEDFTADASIPVKRIVGLEYTDPVSQGEEHGKTTVCLKFENEDITVELPSIKYNVSYHLDTFSDASLSKNDKTTLQDLHEELSKDELNTKINKIIYSFYENIPTLLTLTSQEQKVIEFYKSIHSKKSGILESIKTKANLKEVAYTSELILESIAVAERIANKITLALRVKESLDHLMDAVKRKTEAIDGLVQNDENIVQDQEKVKRVNEQIEKLPPATNEEQVLNASEMKKEKKRAEHALYVHVVTLPIIMEAAARSDDECRRLLCAAEQAIDEAKLAGVVIPEKVKCMEEKQGEEKQGEEKQSEEKQSEEKSESTVIVPTPVAVTPKNTAFIVIIGILGAVLGCILGFAIGSVIGFFAAGPFGFAGFVAGGIAGALGGAIMGLWGGMRLGNFLDEKYQEKIESQPSTDTIVQPITKPASQLSLSTIGLQSSHSTLFSQRSLSVEKKVMVDILKKVLHLSDIQKMENGQLRDALNAQLIDDESINEHIIAAIDKLSDSEKDSIFKLDGSPLSIYCKPTSTVKLGNTE